LSQWDQAPSGGGLYQIFRRTPGRGDKLVYVGETAEFRRRISEHNRGLKRFGVNRAPFSFRVARLPNSTVATRRRLERRLINHYRQRRQLPPPRELELALAQAADALEADLEAGAEGFAVYRVAALPGLCPRFRVAGRLSPEAIRSALRRLPGVFVAGTRQQAQALAQRTAAQTGGVLSGPEAHGLGLTHYHVTTPERRIHIWYRQSAPRGEFYL
jgi:predicted GIY-YIG superfamily endonuclease